jgi:RNA polymerase sigma-70 factor (ECF subfamily)
VIMASPQVGELIDMTSTSIPVGHAGPAGFDALYARHYEAVFRAAIRVTGNPADAEDVLQTVFVRMLSRDHEETARLPTAYFRRAAINAAVDLLRHRAAHSETPYDDLAPVAAGESPPLLKEQLRRAIATLETDDATLFLLRYVEGMSNEELAKLFELRPNNIAVRLHRIRLRLQQELER